MPTLCRIKTDIPLSLVWLQTSLSFSRKRVQPTTSPSRVWLTSWPSRSVFGCALVTKTTGAHLLVTPSVELITSSFFTTTRISFWLLAESGQGKIQMCLASYPLTSQHHRDILCFLQVSKLFANLNSFSKQRISAGHNPSGRLGGRDWGGKQWYFFLPVPPSRPVSVGAVRRRLGSWQTDRQTDRQTVSQSDRQTDRQSSGLATVAEKVCQQGWLNQRSYPQIILDVWQITTSFLSTDSTLWRSVALARPVTLGH